MSISTPTINRYATALDATALPTNLANGNGQNDLGNGSQGLNARASAASVTVNQVSAGGARGSGVNPDSLAALSVSPLALSGSVREVITDFIGNDRRTAYNIGDVNDLSFNWTDSVSVKDRTDVYRFRLDNAAKVGLKLTEMTNNADLYLLDNLNKLITSSTSTDAFNESISRFLNAGVYYVVIQSASEMSTSYTFDLNADGPFRTPIGSLSTAKDFGDMSRTVQTLRNGFLSPTDPKDYLRFNLSERGTFRLDLTGLSSNLDVSLLDRNGNTITSSSLSGNSSESINRFLEAGVYHIYVYSQGSTSEYLLNARVDLPSYSGATRTLIGSLGADAFDFTGDYARTVISGNGNVDFGGGSRDVLDLSSLLSTSVTFNYATATTGGILYNPGNGTRVFDTINLSDGRQILFEGIESIQFADGFVSRSLSKTPNDPGFDQQFNLHMIGVQTAWRFTTGSSNVLIGIEDTGLGVSNGSIHPDLSPKRTISSSDNLADEFPADSRNPSELPPSHGTSVQGIIAATSNNGMGISGINWNSTVVHIDVLGDNVGDQSIAKATQNLINYAASHGKRLVINMSLYNKQTYGRTDLNKDFEQIVAANPNVLFVIAAGNDGNQGREGISYPAALAQIYDNVIAVGAAWGKDPNGTPRIPGTRIDYSQYGKGLTLMAPSEVLATRAQSTTGAVTFGYSTRFNGTSAAAPHVTGIASLLWSVNPTLSAVQVKDILAQTAVDLGPVGYDVLHGSGMVNADAAVRRAIAIARDVTA